MAGLRSVTNNYIVGKKIVGIWGNPEDPNPIPKRQLILLSEDGAFTVTCVEAVIEKVEEFKTYRFVLDNDIAYKKTKIVDVLVEDKK